MSNFEIAALLLVYLFPAMVGFTRHHPGSYLILLLNLCLGWTIIGWIAVLILAVSTAKKKAVQ